LENQHLLTDIRLQLRRSELRPVYEVAVDRRRVPKQPGWYEDLGVISGRHNLGQAVVIRLLTPHGELSELGHPAYGSRLHELVGRQNNENTRNLVKLYILESLQLEPRIETVNSISVTPTPGRRDSVDVLLVVQPVGQTEVVTIGPFTLEFEK
jgi:phage baseplate assembly protein W